MPVSPYVGIVKAEYDYEATTEDELSITEGQVLYLLEEGDDQWSKVQLKVAASQPAGKPGLVPSSYVQPLPPIRTAVALYQYAAQPDGDEELDIEEDEKLLVYDEGEDDGQWVLVGHEDPSKKGVGFVPGNYIEMTGASAQSAVNGDDDDDNDEHSALPPATMPPAITGASAKDVKTWAATEIDSKKKKKKGTLAIGNGALFFASESDKAAVQKYPLSDLSNVTTEKSKHIHLTFPSAELHYSIPTKDAFNEVMAKIEADRSGGEPAPAPEPVAAPPSPPPVASPPPPPPVAAPPPVASPPRALPPPLNTSFPPPPTRNGTAAAPASAAGGRGVRFAEEDPEEMPPATPVSVASLAFSSTSFPPGGVGKPAVALYDFDAETDDELSVRENEKVMVLEGGEGDEWWRVRRVSNGAEGVVPASFVELEDTEGAAAAAAAEAEARQLEAEAAEAEAEALRRSEAEREEAEVRARAAQEAAMEKKREAERRRKEQEVKDLQAKARGMAIAGGSGQAPPRPTRPDAGREGSSSSKSASSSSAGPKSKPDPSRVRTWRDRSGQFRVEAQLLGVSKNNIKLHKVNGVVIEVPLEKLSQEDVDWLRKARSRANGASPANDDDTPLAVVAGKSHNRQPSGPRPTPSPRPHPPPGKPVDWFDFFLQAGCDMNDCNRYEQNFVKERIEESLLPDLQDSTLRSLGLKEGDVIRVRRLIQKKFPAANAASPEPSNEARGTPPNLFSGPGGQLKNTRRGRPQNNRAPISQVSVDSIASASSELTARAATPPVRSNGVASPIARASSTPIGGFDDDAWTPKASSKPSTPAPPPAAPTPVAAAPAPSPQPPAAAATPQPPPDQAPTPTPQIAALQRAASTTPATTSTGQELTESYLASIGLGTRPPSAPAPTPPASAPQSQFNPNGPRGPVAPLPVNQSLLAPLIPTHTAATTFVPTRPSPLGPQATGFQPMLPQPTGFAGMSQSPFANPLMAQPTGFGSGFQAQSPFANPIVSQPTGFPGMYGGTSLPTSQPPLQPQATGFPGGGSFPNFMPQSTGSSTSTTSTSADKYMPGNVFASMKAGAFGDDGNKLGPQSADKYNALRPQPTGMPFGQVGQTGMPGQMLPQQTGFQQPLMYQQTGMPQQQQYGYGQRF